MKLLTVFILLVGSGCSTFSDSIVKPDMDEQSRLKYSKLFESTAKTEIAKKFSPEKKYWAGINASKFDNGEPVTFKEARFVSPPPITVVDDMVSDHWTCAYLKFYQGEKSAEVEAYCGFAAQNEKLTSDNTYLDEVMVATSDPIEDFRDDGKKVLRAINKRQIYMGMPEDAVIASWGKPKEINKTQTQFGTHDQLVYSLTQYVYTENGKVTSWQQSSR